MIAVHRFEIVQLFLFVLIYRQLNKGLKNFWCTWLSITKAKSLQCAFVYDIFLSVAFVSMLYTGVY